MKGQLHHIEIYVKSLEKSYEFWSWLLSEMGYELYQSWNSGFSYVLGQTYLVFVQTEDKHLDIPFHRCKAGLNHLAFHGENKQFVDDITTKLKERGIPILYEEKHPHAGGNDNYGVYFEDPDRLKVEITL